MGEYMLSQLRYIAEKIRETNREDGEIVNAAADHIESLEARVRELEAIVEWLPKTADGVYRIPMDYGPHDMSEVYAYITWPETPDYPAWSGIDRGLVESVDADNPEEECVFYHEKRRRGECIVCLPTSNCYSTREAAEAACQSEGGG